MCKSLLFLVLFIHLDFRHRPGREQNYGNPNWDIRNRFVAIALYKLATLTGHNYALRTVSCGWQANLILTLLSGMAFKVGLSSDVANVGVGTQRPNFVYRGTNTCSRDTIVKGGGAANCIHTSAYAIPAIYFWKLHRNDRYGR